MSLLVSVLEPQQLLQCNFTMAMEVVLFELETMWKEKSDQYTKNQGMCLLWRLRTVGMQTVGQQPAPDQARPLYHILIFRILASS